MTADSLARVAVGRSGVEVTRLVLGSAPLGGLYAAVSDERAQDTLEAAWRGGVRAYDTAPHYGVGLAEERIGRFLAGVPAGEATISSKVGRLLVDTEEDVEGVDEFYGTPRRRRVRDDSRDGVRRSVSESLRRLGIERLDIAFIHDPEGYERQALDEAYPALEELRAEGVVRAIGVGTKSADVASWFVERAELDCVMIAGSCSLLGVEATEQLFPACVRRGVTVLAAGVYKSGVLADPRPGAHVDYAPAPATVLARVASIRTVCERHGVRLPAAALQYVLRHEEVGAVVVGAANAREVGENLEYLDAEVPDELFGELAHLGLTPALASRPHASKDKEH